MLSTSQWRKVCADLRAGLLAFSVLTSLHVADATAIERQKVSDVRPLLLAALNIEHEEFFSERSLSSGKEDQVAATIETLRKAGHIYEGRLPPPKGQLPEDWEDREQTLFRATDFGDDVDANVKLLEAMLAPEGYQVITASSGEAGLEVLAERLDTDLSRSAHLEERWKTRKASRRRTSRPSSSSAASAIAS